jgi:2-polyprenyl-3-methyl-5-hydroxy-6-metoxy-1,4-benzoquinol methylase
MDREAWNRRYEGEDLIWTAQPNRFMAGEVAGLSPGRALDLGAGEGRNAVWLAEQGWDTTAVDFSEVGLAKGEELAARRGVRVKWVQADLRDYEPPAGAFDLVVVVYIHLPADERRGMLAAAASAVAPGGALLVLGHDSSNIEHGYGGPQDPTILFTAEEVAEELDGLEIERAEPVIRRVETPEGEVEAIDAFVRARRASD